MISIFVLQNIVMAYFEDYNKLKQIHYSAGKSSTAVNDAFRIINIPFYSPNNFVPGIVENPEPACTGLIEYLRRKNELGEKFTLCMNDLFEKEDYLIEQNNNFEYLMFKNTRLEKSKKVTVLMHGFNEKKWDKYLPWAKALMERTGKDIILFPASFHMNRAPAAWSSPRLMNELSRIRKRVYPENTCSSLVNASISTRLNLKPIRFLWSGMKTIFDLIQLVNIIRNNKHPFISPEAGIDFFAYSVGAFLSEIMLMANPDNLFGDSRLFIFCGGPIFEMMDPVSKFILDSAANNVIHNYYVDKFEENVNRSPFLASFFKSNSQVGAYFRSMLSANNRTPIREKRLAEISMQISALALAQDDVIKPICVTNTLNGGNNRIPIKVNVMDFPYAYDHINPFPLNEKIQPAVNSSFQSTFDIAADFLG